MSNTTSINSKIPNHFLLTIYVWNGLSKGELHQNYIAAPSKSAAHLKLTQKNITVLSISKINPINTHYYNKKSVLFILEQLAPLLEVGIPLLQSLKLIAPMQSKPWEIFLELIMLDIYKGKTLSQTLNLYPNIFSSICIYFIMLGELTGRLDECLAHLITQQQQQITLREDLWQALRYPLFISISSISLLILIMMFILPEMENFYRLSNVTLPVITQYLIAIKENMVSFFPYLSSGLLLTFFYYRFQRKKSTFLSKLEQQIIANFPYFNQFVNYAFLNHFFHALFLLQRIGVPLIKCLTIINESIPQQTHKEILQSITNTIQNGYNLAHAMQQHPKLFSTLCYQLIYIGEESGKLDVVFLKLYEYHKKILQQKIKKISTLIGPILTLFISFMISFILFALYLPLFNLGETIA